MKFKDNVYVLVVIFCSFSPRSDTSLAGNTQFRIHQNRVIGGANAQNGQLPYMVSLQRFNSTNLKWEHICGASIICEDVVLTAGHCLLRMDLSQLRIKAGITDLDESGQIFKILSIKIHPYFERQILSHDIGLIYLENKLSYQEFISPIKIPMPNRIFAGTALIGGWGITHNNEDIAHPMLQYAHLPVIPHDGK